VLRHHVVLVLLAAETVSVGCGHLHPKKKLGTALFFSSYMSTLRACSPCLSSVVLGSAECCTCLSGVVVDGEGDLMQTYSLTDLEAEREKERVQPLPFL